MTPKEVRPPKLFRLVVWCSGGKFKVDALDDFDKDYRLTLEKFGRMSAYAWATSQAVRSIWHWIWLLLNSIWKL